MSWFNFNGQKVRGTFDFLFNVTHNKGKFVKVVDDITDKELSNKEIELLERERNTIVPHIEEIENLGRKPAPIVVEIQNGRKYKPRRKAIDAKLRREIKIRDNNKCQNCGKDKADQIHHINENPSDNRKDNLELLCYDCHKLLHRKKVKS